MRMPRGFSSPFRFQRSDHRPEPRILSPRAPTSTCNRHQAPLILSVGTSIQPSGGNRNQTSSMASMDPSSSSPGDEPMTQNKWPAPPTSRQNNKGKEPPSSDRGLGKGTQNCNQARLGIGRWRKSILGH
ncbi:hypothetical protein I7I51_08882 [Histoplasma capsulatum]|uniref:Uncharacterized protein n=1 Tax=Ajellomyces capsulatus TaxID=5037 RepID=A0A8A1M5H6_AJECA|nr:hypothetical protein I7I51_08882 [Histoplasma capsulatum]